MSNLESIISGLPGFKIADSHFRIGSKIHISDFYYAKRFFQNGFFASRVAFILAKDIADQIENCGKLEDVKKNGLTLVGYEMYSALLLSLVDKFLRIKWNLRPDKLNHNLFEDAQSLKLCKTFNILNTVVIIVPIASTFSTAVKIEHQLIKLFIGLKNKQLPYFIKPHFNVLYVSDGNPNDEISEIERSFGWESKKANEKIIDVKAFYVNDGAQQIRPQKYYLSVSTQWYKVEECLRCHPLDSNAKNDPRKELPLYETDRTAVTPSIIFDVPKGRNIESADLNRVYQIDSNSVKYGHHTRNNRHFLYGINSEEFLDKNLVAVGLWLRGIKESRVFKSQYKETHRVILISACHYSNSAFINLINETLFSASANIIHYDASNDYIQNFKIVYGREIIEADRIYFIDDSLKSGSAFENIYQFVQTSLVSDQNLNSVEESKLGLSGDFSLADNTSLGNRNTPNGIKGCFFLLNKSQPLIYRSVSEKIDDSRQFYAFANLHLYTSLRPDEVSPLQVEEQRYLELAKSCMLDSLRVHFYKQARKLNTEETPEPKVVHSDKAERHLMMLVATHRIYQYFKATDDYKLNNFPAFMQDLNKRTRSPIDGVTKYIYRSELSEIDYAYLKVLTQSPFVQYKPLRTKVFGWVLNMLINFVEELKISLKSETLKYKQFQDLKFLIRRAGLLNSNYLLSKEFLLFIIDIYGKNGIPKLIKQLQGIISGERTGEQMDVLEVLPKDIEDALNKIKEFPVFYTAQIKELLLRNEARAIKIADNVKVLAKENHPRLKQIYRIIKLECWVIVQRFYENISQDPAWKELYLTKKKSYTIEYVNDKIVEFLKKPAIADEHRFRSINLFFEKVARPDALNNSSFLNYLWLKYFIEYDLHKKGAINLDDKADYIMSKLTELFPDYGLPTPGAFLIVNDNTDNAFFAYNKNENDTIELDASKWNTGEMGYFADFLNGRRKGSSRNKNYYRTIVELARNEHGQWEDLYDTAEERDLPELSKDVISGAYNRLLLIRLNKRGPGVRDQKAQGIMGFYYKHITGLMTMTDLDIPGYLLLIRDSLSIFIKNHHENDEFRNWQLTEMKRKMSILSGHGKEMLINIAEREGEKYKQIVYTLLKVQRLLIEKKEEFAQAQRMQITDERILRIFKSFFQVGNRTLEADFFKGLGDMVTQIFSFAEVENREEASKLSVHLDIPDDIEFNFDPDLMEMFCFEIFVNAKKNRWIFLEELRDNYNQLVTSNTVTVGARRVSTNLILRITNTGPALRDGELDKIREKKNIKSYDYSSGIELINTILTEFKLGEMTFDERTITSELKEFIVEITLKENKKDGK
ncbi:hypothetical protein [Pedobacter deserti]|uniref:hypothetical protein n=1 Tax=Pedobacter deserti TaxID=2817382 RepID=UPI00210E7C48|nr:hypothetical protein [Pedobacter sp. SYSU D00382]